MLCVAYGFVGFISDLVDFLIDTLIEWFKPLKDLLRRVSEMRWLCRI